MKIELTNSKQAYIAPKAEVVLLAPADVISISDSMDWD